MSGVFAQRGFRFQKRCILYFILKFLDEIERVEIEGVDDEKIDFSILFNKNVKLDDGNLGCTEAFFQAKGGLSIQSSPKDFVPTLRSFMLKNRRSENVGFSLVVAKYLSIPELQSLRSNLSSIRRYPAKKVLRRKYIKAVNRLLGTRFKGDFLFNVMVEELDDDLFEGMILELIKHVKFRIEGKDFSITDSSILPTTHIISYLLKRIEDASCAQNPNGHLIEKGEVVGMLTTTFKNCYKVALLENRYSILDVPWSPKTRGHPDKDIIVYQSLKQERIKMDLLSMPS